MLNIVKQKKNTAMTQTTLGRHCQTVFQKENSLSFYRKEGDNEFMNIIANEINTEVSLLRDCLVLDRSS